MKTYEVIFQDEYNNLYLVGLYKELKDSVPDINGYTQPYGVKLTEEDLHEYPSTFGSCFDLDISNIERYSENEDCYGIAIRGFILDSDELTKTLNDLKK